MWFATFTTSRRSGRSLWLRICWRRLLCGQVNHSRLCIRLLERNEMAGVNHQRPFARLVHRLNRNTLPIRAANTLNPEWTRTPRIQLTEYLNPTNNKLTQFKVKQSGRLHQILFPFPRLIPYSPFQLRNSFPPQRRKIPNSLRAVLVIGFLLRGGRFFRQLGERFCW